MWLLHGGLSVACSCAEPTFVTTSLPPMVAVTAEAAAFLCCLYRFLHPWQVDRTIQNCISVLLGGTEGVSSLALAEEIRK